MLLGAAVALFLLWVGVLVAMAVYSAKRPPEQIVRPMPPSLAAPENTERR
jgi:cation transporter-like permease